MYARGVEYNYICNGATEEEIKTVEKGMDSETLNNIKKQGVMHISLQDCLIQPLILWKDIRRKREQTVEFCAEKGIKLWNKDMLSLICEFLDMPSFFKFGEVSRRLYIVINKRPTLKRLLLRIKGKWEDNIKMRWMLDKCQSIDEIIVESVHEMEDIGDGNLLKCLLSTKSSKIGLCFGQGLGQRECYDILYEFQAVFGDCFQNQQKKVDEFHVKNPINFYLTYKCDKNVINVNDPISGAHVATFEGENCHPKLYVMFRILARIYHMLYASGLIFNIIFMWKVSKEGYKTIITADKFQRMNVSHWEPMPEFRAYDNVFMISYPINNS